LWQLSVTLFLFGRSGARKLDVSNFLQPQTHHSAFTLAASETRHRPNQIQVGFTLYGTQRTIHSYRDASFASPSLSLWSASPMDAGVFIGVRYLSIFWQHYKTRKKKAF
jgi:hypothetical protein